jgi:Cytochrome C oxidase subunit II, transmembrane domain
MKYLFTQVFIDAALSWQVGFQDPATPIIIGIIHFHNHLIFFIVVIGTFVFWLLYKAVVLFNIKDSSRLPSKFTHLIVLEVILTFLYFSKISIEIISVLLFVISICLLEIFMYYIYIQKFNKDRIFRFISAPFVQRPSRFILIGFSVFAYPNNEIFFFCIILPLGVLLLYFKFSKEIGLFIKDPTTIQKVWEEKRLSLKTMWNHPDYLEIISFWEKNYKASYKNLAWFEFFLLTFLAILISIYRASSTRYTYITNLILLCAFVKAAKAGACLVVLYFFADLNDFQDFFLFDVRLGLTVAALYFLPLIVIYLMFKTTTISKRIVKNFGEDSLKLLGFNILGTLIQDKAVVAAAGSAFGVYIWFYHGGGQEISQAVSTAVVTRVELKTEEFLVIYKDTIDGYIHTIRIRKLERKAKFDLRRLERQAELDLEDISSTPPDGSTGKILDKSLETSDSISDFDLIY